MKTEIKITLYGSERNNAVIRLPGRKNPGIALQADSLRGYIEQVSGVIEMIASKDLGGAKSELNELLDDLKGLCKTVEDELNEVGEKLV